MIDGILRTITRHEILHHIHTFTVIELKWWFVVPVHTWVYGVCICGLIGFLGAIGHAMLDMYLSIYSRLKSSIFIAKRRLVSSFDATPQAETFTRLSPPSYLCIRMGRDVEIHNK
eukprot:1659_1